MYQARFIIKLLVISTGLSILIKYGGANLPISATPINVLIIVFLPTVTMVIALGARYTNAIERGSLSK